MFELVSSLWLVPGDGDLIVCSLVDHALRTCLPNGRPYDVTSCARLILVVHLDIFITDVVTRHATEGDHSIA